jgi:hypothetical protein
LLCLSALHRHHLDLLQRSGGNWCRHIRLRKERNILYHEDQSNRFHGNVNTYLLNYTATHPSQLQSLQSLPWRVFHYLEIEQDCTNGKQNSSCIGRRERRLHIPYDDIHIVSVATGTTQKYTRCIGCKRDDTVIHTLCRLQ